MRLVGHIVQLILASLLGAFTAVAMMAMAIVQEVRIPIEGLNGLMAGILTLVVFFVVLVLSCDRFSRHVEVWLASWRASKRSAGIAWRESGAVERERLNLDVEA